MFSHCIKVPHVDPDFTNSEETFQMMDSPLSQSQNKILKCPNAPIKPKRVKNVSLENIVPRKLF